MLNTSPGDIISRYHRAVGCAPQPLGRDLPPLRSHVYGDRLPLDAPFWERAAATLRDEVTRLRLRAWSERERQREQYRSALQYESDEQATFDEFNNDDSPLGGPSTPARVVSPAAPPDTVAFFAPWKVRQRVALRRGTAASLSGLSDIAAQRELRQVVAAQLAASHDQNGTVVGIVGSEDDDDDAQCDATSSSFKARYVAAEADCLDACAVAAALAAVGAPTAISTAAHLMFILPRGEYLVRSDRSRRAIAPASGSECVVTIDGAALIVGAVRCAIQDTLDSTSTLDFKNAARAECDQGSQRAQNYPAANSLDRAGFLPAQSFLPPDVATVGPTPHSDRVAVTLSYARRTDSAHSRGLEGGAPRPAGSLASNASIRRAVTPPPRAVAGPVRRDALTLPKASGAAGTPLPQRMEATATAARATTPASQRMPRPVALLGVSKPNESRRIAQQSPRCSQPLHGPETRAAANKREVTVPSIAPRAKTASRNATQMLPPISSNDAADTLSAGPHPPQHRPPPLALGEPASTLSELYRATATQRRLEAAAVREMPPREQQRVTLQRRTAEWQRVQQQRSAIGSSRLDVVGGAMRPRAASAGVTGARNIPAGSLFSSATLLANGGFAAGAAGRPTAAARAASPIRSSIVPQAPPPIPATPAARSQRFPVIDGGAHAALMRARQLRSDGFDRFLSRYAPRKSLVTGTPSVALSHRAQGGVAIAVSSTQLNARVVMTVPSGAAASSRSSSPAVSTQRRGVSPAGVSGCNRMPQQASLGQSASRALSYAHVDGTGHGATSPSQSLKSEMPAPAAAAHAGLPTDLDPANSSLRCCDVEGVELGPDEVVAPLPRGSLFCRSGPDTSAGLWSETRDARSFLYNA